MLIQFTVGNYLSFKEKVTFSMVATDLGAPTKLDSDNIFQINDELSLLKSAAVYGANASGKSNLVTAIGFMRWFVLKSSSGTQITDSINVEHFRLSTETENKPSFFEIVFISNKKIYRYGFEITDKQVISEWLFYTPKSKEYKCFERNKQSFKVLQKFSEGKSLESKTRRNSLFLSVVAQFNGEISKQILFWFQHLSVMSGINNSFSETYTLRLMEDESYKQDILQLIKKLDLNIEDLKPLRTALSFDNIPKEILEAFANRDGKTVDDIRDVFHVEVQSIHNKYDSSGKIHSIEEFDFDENESEGTKKLFAFAGPILQSLKEGRILCIDELDARLHPFITKSIVELFNSKDTNPHNAQLVFMTHDTNLLSNSLFRKDQIWFVEKDKYGSTDLYSLVEYDIPDDAKYKSGYIKGKYGAIPYIGVLTNLFANS
jgi:uncharacterized protein